MKRTAYIRLTFTMEVSIKVAMSNCGYICHKYWRPKSAGAVKVPKKKMRINVSFEADDCFRKSVAQIATGIAVTIAEIESSKILLSNMLFPQEF